MTMLETHPLTLPLPYKGPEVEADVRLEHPTINKRLRILSKSHCPLFGFLGGLCGMEITVLLLLIVPLTAASPLRPTHRSDADVVLQEDTILTPAVENPEATKEEHVQALKIIPFHSDDKHADLDSLKQRIALNLRPRRAPQRGCQFGTCQVHNLANDLYNISKKKEKDVSGGASDPHSYGK